MGSEKEYKRKHRSEEDYYLYHPGDLRDPRAFPRYSKATSLRYSVPAGSSRGAQYFLLFSTKRGLVPELTPVRSQVVGCTTRYPRSR